MAQFEQIIQGLDLLDLIPQILRKNKKFQAILLQNTEELFAENNEEFIRFLNKNEGISTEELINEYKRSKRTLYTYQRKLLLDWSNGFTRSLLRLIFGTDFEGKLK